MPRRDGTGPMGFGAGTGRGLGPCTGKNAVKYGAGLGFGFGLSLACRHGLRGGFGRGFAARLTPSGSRKAILLAQKDVLQGQISAIDKQIEDV
ncbi:MAG: DUF5320 domain-containing protein [Oscillospiraceae bacterium]